MKITALITMLVLGSSSAAMARPLTVPGDAAAWTYAAQPVRTPPEPRRYDPWRPGTTYYRTRPAQLGRGLSFSEGRRFITVGEGRGRFDFLRIDGNTGRTRIEQVYIEFGNGQEQVIRGINRVLHRGESVMLDLDGRNRAIRRIVVYGRSLFYGRHTLGTFNVTAL